ncbi:MAG TPA: response regulator [Gammaproteobacteria bacterium]|nr:response regulator [Gammaproteobacteria bacterium]
MPLIANSPRYNAAAPFRVLIVDDEPAQRALEREILEPPRYQTVEASNGMEALELIARYDFDAVVLDKRMPGMDGEEVIRRIREDLGEAMLPIIMVTGSSTSEILPAGLRAGATDFIRKPYNAEEFIARVDAAINRKRLTDQLDSAEAVLFALARMVEAKDGGTGDHCTRLAHLALRFGHELGLDAEQLLALRRGGVLHDIGKLGIPDRILLKPGALDEAEWAIMRSHTVIGERLCSALKSFRLTVQIIRSHHERWDGSGYPDALAGNDIPLLARVFQICDIFDALSHPRSYKPGLPRAEVLHILRAEAARGWRDPELMRIFLAMLERDPASCEPPGTDRDLGQTLFEDIRRTADLADTSLGAMAAG